MIWEQIQLRLTQLLEESLDEEMAKMAMILAADDVNDAPMEEACAGGKFRHGDRGRIHLWLFGL